MLDFLMISTRSTKRGTIEIFPKFIVKKSKDLMIRGGDFYAIWDDVNKLWTMEEQEAIRLIDEQLDIYAKEKGPSFDGDVKVLHLWDADTGMIDKWHKYCQKQAPDSYHALDEKLIFANSSPKKTDYASHTLPYPLEACDTSAYDELMSVLYLPSEREKIEWAIGSIVAGASKKIQKFVVLYGAAGTGKSTVLNIIQSLFQGYYSVFDARALGSSSNVFALEAFKNNPLVAIQHDGDLSRIEDNTRLNSLVSHELMQVNEKFKSMYSVRFNSFLFMGTNKPVKITDAKSGLIRRLIDVSPSGKKVPTSKYNKLVKEIDFELGGIAFKCKELYLSDPHKYDTYVPVMMMGETNDFYDFMQECYFKFKKEDQTTLKKAWALYDEYVRDSKVPYPLSKRIFKQELKNYFWSYEERGTDGNREYNCYYGFRTDKFDIVNNDISEPEEPSWLQFNKTESLLDDIYKDMPAQYANAKGTPSKKWSDIQTKLSDLDTSQLHYVKTPETHIVIDFDIPDENGNKCYEKNLAEASKWKPTYAELSKSGAGIHLHYIYEGDVSKLKTVYDDHIEVKVFTGNSSLRRMLTKCNDIQMATINSGLPLKGEKKVLDLDRFKSEKAIRAAIKKNLRKEVHPGTKPSIDFIFKILEDAYNDGTFSYDVLDMRPMIFQFAARSTHQSEYCTKLVTKMQFKSKDIQYNEDNSIAELVFYDIEVFPNLFLVNYKIRGKDNPVIRLINPSSDDIEKLMGYKLVGFNCRRYDNHILYARLLGYDNEQLYNLSQRIISGERSAFFGEAYNISYTDVYDFSSKKQSLKKFEIELGIHHQELGLPWDKPVPEERWNEVAEYCDNDVIATEAVFEARQADFTARKILAEVAGSTVNDTTNSLTTKIIFGSNRNPQTEFNYRNLAEHSDFMPYFPGYTYERGVSTYKGETVGEGGYVYAEPGIYENIALLDIASMHPSSIVNEELFGPEYTQRFNDILQARIAIKHKDFESAKKMLDGKLAKFLDDESVAADLAQALKIAINSVYGLTSAKFDNPFRDPRNKDNIVAKRGALFMIDLKEAVQQKGYTVAHIKTDSIKIPNADNDIIQFITEFGKQYGYNFEHEATYDRMCLVNDAVYIAKYAEYEKCIELYGEEYMSSNSDICKDNKKKSGKWTATGTQFQIPYVFKKLFSGEEIKFEDLCETKSVTSALYLSVGDDPNAVRFIGKVGSFCPIKEGCGGGKLFREKDGKFYAATGTKGYEWQEAEAVEHNESVRANIDYSYFEKLCDDAKDAINKYGDFNRFVGD